MCLLHPAEVGNFNRALLPCSPPLSSDSEPITIPSTAPHHHHRHHYYRQQVPLHYTTTKSHSKTPQPASAVHKKAVGGHQRRLASFYLSDEEEDEALMLRLTHQHTQHTHHQTQESMNSLDPHSSSHHYHRHSKHTCSKTRAKAKSHGLGLVCCRTPDSSHLPGGAFKNKLNAVINSAMSPIPEGPPPSFSSSSTQTSNPPSSRSQCCYQWRVDHPTDHTQFRQRLLANKVALEAAEVTHTDESVCLSGLVRVLNVSRKKRVFLRVTTDGWRTHEEYKAIYQGSSQQFTENFSFQVPLPSAGEASRLEFRCGYSTESPAKGQPAGTTYWDTNEGLSYVARSEPISLPVIEEESDDEPTSRGEDSGFSSWKDLAGQEEKPYW